MELPLDGREYARWTQTATHDLSEVDPPQVQLLAPDAAEWGEWLATTWLAEAVDKGAKWTRVAGLLVRGPDITGTGTELAAGTHLTRARVNDDPETVVRATDAITVG